MSSVSTTPVSQHGRGFRALWQGLVVGVIMAVMSPCRARESQAVRSEPEWCLELLSGLEANLDLILKLAHSTWFRSGSLSLPISSTRPSAMSITSPGVRSSSTSGGVKLRSALRGNDGAQ
ncbi:hypothetical protein DPEC_G00231060 [Dallia pectoralis]|uniref:Uncharacterized protein n=1 Tax=Dallia pectoralis TaxID=75939 RepID=A0ACC2FX04_DALPE|nr:hypothetical protein DPEC_G00231060 [Dallia pectoralis]